MELGSMLLFAVCAWAGAHFWLLPLAKNRWDAVDARGKLARSGTLVVMEKVRDLSAVAVVVLAAVLLSTWLAGLLGSTSIAVPQAAIASLSTLYEATKAIAEQYGTLLGWVGVAGAVASLYLASQHAKRVVKDAWTAKAREVHDRLRTDPAVLDAARTDPDLQPLVARLDELIGALVANDAAEDTARLSDAAVSETRDQAGRVFSSLAVEIAQKELKFEALVDESTAALPTPTGWWPRVMRVVASERFGKDLGFVKKPLSYVTTGLLVLSLLGWSAEPLANSLQLAVNNLRVNVLDKQVQQDLTQAISRAPEPKPETKEENDPPSSSTASTVVHTAQSAARVLSRAAVDHITRSGAIDQMAHVERPFSSEAEFVRNAINDQHIDVADASDPVAQVRQEVSESVSKSSDGHTASTKVREEIEQALTPELHRFETEHPGRFQKWAHGLEQRYATPMGAMDAQGEILAQMLDEAFGAADAKPATELGKQAQKLAKDVGKDAVKTWAQSWAKAWVTDSIVGSAKPEVQAEVRKFAFRSSAESAKFVNDLVAAEGQGWAGPIERQRDAKVVHAVAEKIASLHEPDIQAVLRERLGGYDELFPKEPSSSSLGGGGGAGVGGGGGSSEGRAAGIRVSGAPNGSSTKVTFAQSRATSFHLASRSFRVRGVLIGQDMQMSGLDIDAIRWSLAPPEAEKSSKLRLSVRQDGGWRDLGSFDAGVVNQALRYAADRRVVATTITPGDGKVVGRITYLHPTLVDTPLGCRVVESDRLIDTFTFASRGEKPSVSMQTLASDREQMHQWMFLARMTEALMSMPKSPVCPREELEKAIKSRNEELEKALGSHRSTAVHFSAALQKSIDDFIAGQQAKLPESPRVLSVVNRCAGAEPSQLAGCLCDQAKATELPLAYWFPEDHTSQFRESAVKGGADWSWMQRTPDRLGNLDLWVHTTFSLRKPESRGDVLDEATASAVDFPPGELRALRQDVAQRLPKYLHDSLGSPSYDDFMAPIEDFIVLQRFFRSALAGGLGRDFPLTQLMKLERDTHRFVPVQPTIRWEPATSSAALQQTLLEANAAAAASYQKWRDDMNRRLASHRPICDPVSN